ncbi:MAG: T9SS type A sorting domain-containing protein [candidate division Zixibacteria bacterium]|nr:T9SS type A sorting domain-containing protein [candidate division Zixibacteria bacterium]
MKTLLTLTIIGTLCISGMVSGATRDSGQIHKMSIAEAQKAERLADVEPIPQSAMHQPAIPLRDDVILDSPGTMVGRTYYDYQTNCSTGNRIAVHPCGIHISWMNGIRDWTGERIIYYNFIEEQGGQPFWGDDGIPATSGTRDGYTTIDMNEDGAAIIAFHNAVSGAEETRVAIDAACGLGLFTEFPVPSEIPGDYTYYWPYVTCDYNGRIHVCNHESVPGAGDPQNCAHTWSEDMGYTWTNLVAVRTLMEIASQPVSSPVDSKVAIVFTMPRNLNDPDQYNNDVSYIESIDGETWNYGDINNITNYQYDDTLRAYCDLDACYDYNGDLHIIWNTPGYWEAEGTITLDACMLWHWSEATGTNLVYNAWHPSYPGAWNRSASKMSISVASDNSLHALWTHFDDIDVSAGGYSNGELYYSYSTDGGVTWSDPVNLTNTATPGCLPGDCDSDHWSTLAEQVDDYIYITYINDKDAGGIPQNEGAQTENPVMYLDHPAEYSQPLDIDVFMQPDEYPTVAPRGGSFGYGGALVNNTDVAQNVDVWLMVDVPDYGMYGPVRLFEDIPIAPLDTMMQLGMRQNVPISAPVGFYDYIAYGGIYPGQAVSETSFEFVVVDPRGGDAEDWNVYGWFEEEEAVIPSETALGTNYPNPFNATTTISYSLPEAGHVSLEIFNMLGQKITTLVDTDKDAGKHSVRWNASDYSSGVYFYKLQTGDRILTNKMNLVK